MKAIKTKLQETNPARVEIFEKNAAAYAKKIVADFKNYEFVSFQFCQDVPSRSIPSRVLHI